MYKSGYAVSASEPSGCPALVFPNATDNIVSDPDVEHTDLLAMRHTKNVFLIPTLRGMRFFAALRMT